jgi:hypothetical protein
LLLPKGEDGGAGQVFPGRNRFINGSFRIWQRGTTFTNNGYTADRWSLQHAGATFTATPVQLPGEGLSSGSAMAINITTLGSGVNLRQPIENVNTLAGKTCTVSFRARGNTAGRLLSVRTIQSFGSGGSPNVSSASQQITLAAEMHTYSVVVALPSVGGKTIGANNFVAIVFDFQSTGVYYISDLQIEEGDVATPFEWRPESTELVLCQRYYEKSYPFGVFPGSPGTAGRESHYYDRTTGATSYAQARFKVTKRTTPSISVYSDQTGALNQISSANGVAGTVTGIGSVGDTAFQVTYASAGGQWGAGFHWVADAEF